MIAAVSTQRRARDAQRAGARRQTLQHISRDASQYARLQAQPQRARDTARALAPGAAHRSPFCAGPDPAHAPIRRLQEGLPWEALDDVHELVEGDRALESSLTLADVIRTFGPEYRRRYGHIMTKQQDRALRELTACYTPLMGTHEWTCDDCGTVVELPNACNNRHCPTCGDAKRRQWAANTASQILPVPYYHVILTVPQRDHATGAGLSERALCADAPHRCRRHPPLRPPVVRRGAGAARRCCIAGEVSSMPISTVTACSRPVV